MDAAHGETDHIEHVQGPHDAEVWPPILPPLEAHQLFHWGLFQDLASLPWKKSAAGGDHRSEKQRWVSHWVPDGQGHDHAFSSSVISFTDNQSASTVR